MYANLTSVHLKPGVASESTTYWRDVLLPMARQQPGFKGALLLRTPTGERSVSLTLWESEAAFQAALQQVEQQGLVARARSRLIAEPEREVYEVIINELR